MPYIKSDDGRREALQRGEPALTAGELNYQIFYYVKYNYFILKERGELWRIENTVKLFVHNFLGYSPNYQRYNDMTGALIRCYKEINRRLGLILGELFVEILDSYDDEIAKYEDTKIIENRDVE